MLEIPPGTVRSRIARGRAAMARALDPGNQRRAVATSKVRPMSDVTPSPDDELVSAYLDGEATPEERALVEARPDLVARVADLRRVADLVAFTEPAPPGAADAAVTAALAAFTGPSPAPTLAPLTDLDARRRRRHGRAIAGLGAAAALVLVVVVGVAVLRGRSSSGTAATSAAESADVAAAGPPGTPTGKAGGTALTPDAANGAQAPLAATEGPGGPGRYVGALGSFTDEAALGRTLRPYLQPAAGAGAGDSPATSGAAAVAPPAPAQAAPASGAIVQRLGTCAATRQGDDPTLGPVALTGRATVDGAPVDVLVFAIRPTGASPAGGYQVVTVTPDCRLLSSHPL